MATYPALSADPTIDWGPGWAIMRDGDQDDLDAAVTVHRLALDGDTIASIEISTSAGTGRIHVAAGIELTRGDCLGLAKRLIDVATSQN